MKAAIDAEIVVIAREILDECHAVGLPKRLTL
jgi:hypothetical protein